MTKPDFATRLDKLARLAVETGLGSVRGQELVITAPLEAVVLARRIAHHAYANGATVVTTLYSDDQATLERFKTAEDAAFDVAPAWLYDGMAAASSRSGNTVFAQAGVAAETIVQLMAERAIRSSAGR